MTYGIGLLGLAFAVARSPELLPVTAGGDPVAGMPEIRRLRLVSDARKHAPLLTAFNLPESIAAELEVIALLVDGEAAVAVDENAVVDS